MSGDINDASIPPEALRGLTDEQTERLTAVLDRYLAALEQGEPLDLDGLVSEHADLRAPLQLYLGKLSELHHFSAGFSPQLVQLDTSEEAEVSTQSVERLSGDNPLMAEDDAPEAGQGHADSPRGRVPTSLLTGDIDPQTQPPQARRLGDFELLRVIGRGGMGIVYEARQLSLKRHVALKLLPLISVLDSRQITRFKNEAQAAASLQHAHIVPVYAVGSYQGVHYYAMRLIDGKPLDAIIETLREQQASDSPTSTRSHSGSQAPLGTEVQLSPEQWQGPTDFRAVVSLGIHTARALAFAHGEGIVHRDIKPSNLIVDGQGKVWITDFGLARRVSDHSLTATGDVMGTLRYMSPEQARGETALIDGRSDIYSLAVTLYELLALQPAMVGENSPAMIRAIEKQTPVSLRHHRPDLPRDLVTVLETAMAKNRDDRYLTAQQFADDLQRVLQGLPTLAKPPSLIVRVAKWTLRNQRTTKIAALVTLALLLTIGSSAVLIWRTTSQAAADREKLLQSLEACFGQTAPELESVPGAEHARQQLLIRMLDSYRSFVNDSRRNPALRSNLAMGLMHEGELYYELGEVTLAERSLTEARALYRSLAIASPRNVDLRRQLAQSNDQLGRVLRVKGDMQLAEQSAREAVEGFTTLTAAHPASPVFLVDRARATNHLALLLADAGQAEEAQRLLMETRSLLESFHESSDHDDEATSALAATYNNLARLAGSGDDKAKLEFYDRSIDLMLELAEASPLQTPSADLAVAYSNRGKALAHHGERKKAAQSYQQAIGIQELLVRIAPLNYNYKRDLAISHNNLGLVELENQQIQSAEKHFGDAIGLEEQLLLTRQSDSGLMHELGGTYNNLAMLYRGRRETPSVESAFEAGIRYQAQAVSLAPTVLEYRQFLDRQLQNYSQWLQELGRDEQALKLLRQRLALWPEDGERVMAIAKELAEVALTRMAQASKKQAGNAYVTAMREAISLAEKSGFSVQSRLTQEPFLSLAKLKGSIE